MSEPFSEESRAAHQRALWPLAAAAPIPLPWTEVLDLRVLILYEALLLVFYLRARRARPVHISNALLNVLAVLYVAFFYREVRFLHHGLVKTATNLLREVPQEERIHRALEADMQLADLALGQRHHLDAGEGETLVQSGDVLLVAGETIERLRDHDIECAGARVLKELLISRPEAARPAAGGIAVGCPKLPALPLDALAADADLVVDGGLALQVG